MLLSAVVYTDIALSIKTNTIQIHYKIQYNTLCRLYHDTKLKWGEMEESRAY